MDTNHRGQLNDDYENMNGMRKIMYLQKHSVKSFPYHGRHRYTPSINQSVDGGIIISNDVFGLTIRQFERIYKVCLDRRKTHEQWILNLRYPDKSSNEYLKNLQECIYYNEGKNGVTFKTSKIKKSLNDTMIEIYHFNLKTNRQPKDDKREATKRQTKSQINTQQTND
ncbi:unnamed protein product [Mytilus edulis]|uniref:Uncharacterized protein n=1 Tax=Mytilus edulis TaxID=6550 RepID=A0A8S3SSB5_MYTED|nr:unnamed protein product [Mytilus edulis]